MNEPPTSALFGLAYSHSVPADVLCPLTQVLAHDLPALQLLVLPGQE